MSAAMASSDWSPMMPAEPADAPPAFVAVEGPIGVGKTSLVKRLARSLQCHSLLEQAEENPFLGRFYQDARSAAFPAQLHFLFQRSRQLQQIRQRDLFSSGLIADFMFDKDRLFAELNLDDDELALYDEVFQRLSMDAPAPDLVVYLQAPVEVLMQRVRQRDRAIERTLSAAYLERLSAAYHRFFYRYDRSPLLIVDASRINPIDSQSDFDQLLAEVCRPLAGRRYFNAEPLTIN
jgi:deoxyadenosine/deoxycytidine kinase